MAGVVEGRSDDLVSESLPRQSPDEEATVKTPDEAPTPQRKLGKHAQHKQWWQPVVDMKFDDPGQEQPRLYWSNNVRAPLPWPDTWLTGWRNVNEDGLCGVALSGKEKSVEAFWRVIRGQAWKIEAALPKVVASIEGRFGIRITKPNSEFGSDEEKRAWIKEMLNQFALVLRPYIERQAKQHYGDTRYVR
jgi:acylphosphatase